MPTCTRRSAGERHATWWPDLSATLVQTRTIPYHPDVNRLLTRSGAVVALFSMTVFVNAALLFAVQPMFSKMVLPMLGGTPSVWNTCMLFFQTALLGGYLYAHVTTQWLDVRKQSYAAARAVRG